MHTVPHGTGWANKVEGNSPVSTTAPMKAEAQKRGREMAMNAGSSTTFTRRTGRSASATATGATRAVAGLIARHGRCRANAARR